MNKARSSIVFTGGGTLGHIFPGLAVAEALRDMAPDAPIHFAGHGTGSERQHVEQAGHAYHLIACHPWPRRPGLAGRFVAKNLRGFLDARRMLRDMHAAVVVGLGGYASAPVARAAVSLNRPLVLLEQNAVPGRVNRWLSRYAVSVCTAFGVPAAWRSARIHHTGNPVRRAFVDQPAAGPREKLLLVTGGSLGASALNAAAPEALAPLKPLLDGWRIIHQSGDREAEATAARYRRFGLAAEVTAFADLPALLPSAGLVVCRAGGSTIAELQVSGTPAILCPYPQASDDHQRCNAAALGDACRVVEQPLPDFSGRLSHELAVLLTDAALRGQLARAMFVRSRHHAARRVARLVAACRVQ